MKKITILVDQLSSHGGIEKLVAIKANYWADVFYYQVTIISTDQNQLPSIYVLSSKVKFVDFNINFDRDKSFYSVSNLFKLLKNIFLIQKHLLFSKPNFVVVASHIPLTYIVPFLIGGGKKIKEFHYSQFYMNTISIVTKIQDFMIARYDYVVALSEEEKMYYYSKNVVVISNPILKIDSRLKINLNTKAKTALFVGRIAPVKQLEVLIEIWDQFTLLKPSWQLHIYGAIDSEYAIGIQNIIIEKKLSSTIYLKGQSQTIEQELSKSNVLLVTSAQECFPMVILESQALGIPVISFDSPTGPRNIITNDFNGILVEHNNNDKFVKALVRFDEDKILQEKLSINGLETSKIYNLDLVMNRWNDLIFNK